MNKTDTVAVAAGEKTATDNSTTTATGKTVAADNSTTTATGKTAASTSNVKVLCAMSDGSQGIPVWKNLPGFQSIAESQCRLLVPAADFTLSLCNTDLQACINQTVGPLETRMETTISTKRAVAGCEAFSEIDPSHPVKDRYCCTPSAFGSILHDVYQSDASLALQRELQTDCFP